MCDNYVIKYLPSFLTVHGQWGAWGNYTECSHSCGSGKKQRLRLCDSPAPDYGGDQCVGEPVEIINCNTEYPCPVHGQWGAWEPYSDCSHSCEGGTMQHFRRCDSPAPAYEGEPCVGEAYETVSCNSDIPCYVAPPVPTPAAVAWAPSAWGAH